MTDTFDPRQKVRQIRGKGGVSDYLDVKWRLVWLRDEHPDAVIETVLVAHEPTGSALFRARVELPTGGIATGYGSETASDFPDYLEKAETKAIGRALNHLGYSVEVAFDGDEPDGEAGENAPARPQRGQQSANGRITQQQIKETSRLRAALGWKHERMNEEAGALGLPANVGILTVAQADQLIARMSELVAKQQPQQPQPAERARR